MSDSDLYIRLSKNLVACVKCGSLILDTRKDQHTELHNSIEELKEKVKEEISFNDLN